jgi:hypothetical protein
LRKAQKASENPIAACHPPGRIKHKLKPRKRRNRNAPRKGRRTKNKEKSGGENQVLTSFSFLADCQRSGL